MTTTIEEHRIEPKAERTRTLLNALVSEDFRQRLSGENPFAILDKRVGTILGPSLRKPLRKVNFPDITYLDLQGPKGRPGAWEDEITEHPGVRDDKRTVLAVVDIKPRADFSLKPDEDDLYRLRNVNKAQTTRGETILILASPTSDGDMQLLFLKEKHQLRTEPEKRTRMDKLAKDLASEGDQAKILQLLGEDYERVYLRIPRSTLNFSDAQLGEVLRLTL